jgi:hypothetical protein
MPIIHVSKDTSGPVVTAICAACMVEQTIPALALQLGTRKSANVIELPPCACGAQEFLQRTFDVHPTESEAGHRKTVNALASHLKSSGRIHPDHVDTIRNETKEPTQVGPLVGPVPETSLPPKIVAKRGLKRRAAEMSAQAAAAASSVDPSKLDPSDPLLLAVKMFEQAQAAFKIASDGAKPAAAPAP